jgi:hypothetical protein
MILASPPQNAFLLAQSRTVTERLIADAFISTDMSAYRKLEDLVVFPENREVARHGGRPVDRASEADQRAWKLALRPKACQLASHRKLRLIVAVN